MWNSFLYINIFYSKRQTLDLLCGSYEDLKHFASLLVKYGIELDEDFQASLQAKSTSNEKIKPKVIFCTSFIQCCTYSLLLYGKPTII